VLCTSTPLLAPRRRRRPHDRSLRTPELQRSPPTAIREKEIADVGRQPQRGAGGSSGSVCWRSSPGRRAPRARVWATKEVNEQRKVRGRVHFTNSDRLFFIQLYRWFPSILKAMSIIRPETLVRWHRAGIRRYWRCKSRSVGGRPQINADLRVLIRRMSVENLLWGAPRIHGELLKLGFALAQSTVAKYMTKKGDPSGQSWGTFLHNHSPHIAAMDLFVVPTIGSNLLYVLVIVRLARRELVWINVTAHPTAEWIAQQITEAFPWTEAPRYLIRDRDAIYGSAVTRRL